MLKQSKGTEKISCYNPREIYIQILLPPISHVENHNHHLASRFEIHVANPPVQNFPTICFTVKKRQFNLSAENAHPFGEASLRKVSRFKPLSKKHLSHLSPAQHLPQLFRPQYISLYYITDSVLPSIPLKASSIIKASWGQR